MEIKSDKVIGISLDIFIPSLRLAFVFPSRGTTRERSELGVIQHLCSNAGIILVLIESRDQLTICTEIKQGFARAHIYIDSDNDEDLALVKKRFMQWQQRDKN